MTNAIWKPRVDEALTRLGRDRWTAPAVRYMEIIDDVAAGRGSAADIARRAGSAEMVRNALGRVTLAVHGGWESPPLEAGGWYEAAGDLYRVAPAFAQEWRSARDAQRRIQARQSL